MNKKTDIYQPAQEWQATRNALAKALQSARYEFKEVNVPPNRRNKLIRGILRDAFTDLPPKPTRANLLRHLRGLEAFGKTPITDYSTEYYSTCGLDDYQWELRQEALAQAKDLRRTIYAEH